MMFGREANLPIDIQFHTSSSEQGVSPHRYVDQLQKTLKYSYQIARDSIGQNANKHCTTKPFMENCLKETLFGFTPV